MRLGRKRSMASHGSLLVKMLRRLLLLQVLAIAHLSCVTPALAIDVTSQLGATATFDCPVSSENSDVYLLGPQTVESLRLLLQENSRVSKASSDQSTQTLTLTNVQKSDQGKYKCLTISEGAFFQLTVANADLKNAQLEPAVLLKPPTTLTAEAESTSSIHVTWADPDQDKDTVYTVRYRKQHGTASSGYVYSSSSSREIGLSNLEPDTGYELAVMVTRGEITSPYSQSVVCKTLAIGLPQSRDNWPPYESIRLPQSLVPEHYRVQVAPRTAKMADDGDYFVNQGEVDILIQCKEETDIIRLHSKGQIITDISVESADPDSHGVGFLRYRFDAAKEMLEIQTSSPLQVGGKYRLHIEYTNRITGNLKGFYYSPYKEQGETRYIFTTMNEPTDARHVFPCWDEPDFKAGFEIVIIAESRFTAISNMPLQSSVDMDGGLRKDVFVKSVKMSTYLVAFAIGDLEHIETSVNNVLVQAWSRRGTVHLTEFALDICAKTMAFFEEYFQIKYPLPKIDTVALPTLSFNAMEHWGMMSCREEALFIEDGVSSRLEREWTAKLMAHEVSHQWFGNLVSPGWWDDLWLNEGFATYMMFLAVDDVYPEWKLMNKLTIADRGTQSVFAVDDVIASHPVYIPVNHPDEINQIFDLISYAKGCAVIRMMNFFLSDGTFKRGLHRYLKEREYNTATHDDLWQALTDQAVEDGNDVTDVKSIMGSWILEENYPVVMVTRTADDVLHLSQSPFLQTAEARQMRENGTWEIPFVYTTELKPEFETQTAENIAWLHTDGNVVSVSDPTLAGSSWVIGNILQYGYYRVNYEHDNWMAIIEQLKSDHTVIHPINRAQILDDAWNLATAGLTGFDVALGTFEYLGAEDMFSPWVAALRTLDFLDSVLQLEPAYGKFKLFMQSKLAKPYSRRMPNPGHYDKALHAMIAGQACRFGLRACVVSAVEEFNRWKSLKNYHLDPDYKASVYCTGVREGTSEDWQYVFDQYKASNSSSDKKFLLKAMACTTEPWILARFLDLCVRQEDISNIDAIDAIVYIGSTPAGRLISFDFVTEHWDFFFNMYGSVLNLFAKLITGITKSYNKGAELRKLEDFVTQLENQGTAKRAFENAITHARLNVAWMEKHYPEVSHWLDSASAAA